MIALPSFIESHLLYNSSMPGGKLVHGFFGRRGGVSTGVYESLNCSVKEGDLKDTVLKNHRLIAEALEMKEAPIIFLNQKHTNVAVIADSEAQNLSLADAFVTTQKNILIAIQTADCVPVLLADPRNGVIAAAHGGWRGLASGILENTVVKMESLGAERGFIKAAIGPCIWAESFEVGEDVKLAFPNFQDLFLPWAKESQQNKMTYAFDLPEAAYRTLSLLGLAQISRSFQNTYAAEEDYFSFRRNTHRQEARFGCQASVIGIRSDDI